MRAPFRSCWRKNFVVEKTRSSGAKFMPRVWATTNFRAMAGAWVTRRARATTPSGSCMTRMTCLPRCNGARMGCRMVLGNGWFNPSPRMVHPLSHAVVRVETPLASASPSITRTAQPKSSLRMSQWQPLPAPVLSFLCLRRRSLRCYAGGVAVGSSGSRRERLVARVHHGAPGGALVSHAMPPIRVVEHIAPFAGRSPAPGVYVFDFGQNFAGWSSDAEGPRGPGCMSVTRRTCGRMAAWM